jgi:sulfoxide reductase heme-binding subunit YedZ
MAAKRDMIRYLKAAIWLGCLAPCGRLIFLGLTGQLGANPVEFITLSTGTWTLVFILVTISITPLRKITGQTWLTRLRRLIGLFAFFYACLHFITYIWLDKFFDAQEVIKDLSKRPFIMAGFLAFLTLIPLACTSTARSIRAMGGRNWQLSHRLIYLSSIAAVTHFWWKVKADVREPAIYAAILALLLGFRVLSAARKREPQRPRTPERI